MKKKFFGTDGIRGVANKYPITPSFLYELAIAIANVKEKKCNILIGRDTRVSGEMIENSIISGFESVGSNCDSLEIVSTPMLSFYTKLLR